MILAASGALSACGPRGQARPEAKAVRVRIGYQKNDVLVLAKSRGQFQAVLPGMNVEWSEFVSGPPLLEALAAGAVDLGATGDSPPLFAQAAGAPLRYVAVQPLTGQSEAILISKISPIARVEDLSGRRVAFTKGSSSHLLVVKALAKAGLSLTDIQPIYLSPADASARLVDDAPLVLARVLDALRAEAAWGEAHRAADQQGHRRGH